MKFAGLLKETRLTGKRKLLVPAVVVLVLLAAAGGWYLLVGQKTLLAKKTASTAPSYQTALARRGSLRISAAGSGVLGAKNSADLAFSTSGTVAELNVRAGDRVNKGDVLARLGGTESLQASAASAELNYLQAQKDLADLEQGMDVSLATAYQAWIQAKQDYATALTKEQRSSYARCSKEVNTNYAAALERAKSRLDALTPAFIATDAWVNARNVYDTALANYNYCITFTADEKTNFGASLKVAEATLKTAEEKYNTLKNSATSVPQDLDLAEAKLEDARLNNEKAKKDLEGTTLTAPFDGTISYLAADQGSAVGTSTFITVSDLSRLVVKFSVDEADLTKLAIGRSAEAVFDALPDEVFKGQVVQLDPEVVTSGSTQVAKGTVELDASASDRLASLPLGLNSTITIIQQDIQDALFVPLEALRDLGDKEYGVFVLKDGKLQLKTVTAGLKDSTRVQIVSGLNEGDTVTTGMVPTSK